MAAFALVPGAAGGDDSSGTNDLPFVPATLRTTAAANPTGLFRVIIQGDTGYSSRELAGDVQGEQGDHPGRARGTKRKFRSLIAVSAELTGRQLLDLARRPELLAITPDSVLKPASDLALPGDPPPVDPTPPPVDPTPPPVNPTPPSAPTPADGPAIPLPPVLPPLDAATAPTAIDPPTISGTAAVGETLTAANGTWAAAPTDPLTFTFRWQRCDATGAACADIEGATAGSYTATADDIGATLRITVTAAGLGGSATAASVVTAVVTGVPPRVVTAPAVRGTAAWGQTLSADPGIWQAIAPQPFRYQWQRCDASGGACTDIATATESEYRVTAGDIGATVRVVVTASDSGGTTAAPSAATPLVVAYSNAQLWPYSLGIDRLWPATIGTTADPSAPAIAIVDSGVDASAAGLGDRLVHQERMTALTPNAPGDGRGHGTFVAGIAAGGSAGFAGADPRARIVSIDVMDDNGMAMTSDVIAAADWIATHKSEYGIRVANFSLIGTSPTTLLYDPLDAAVEKLWLAGVVVVAASGNYAVAGADSGVPYAPGNDPFVVTVGASDINGTATPADDVAAPWSAYGHTPDGFAKPEIGAPGRYLVAGVPPTSTLAVSLPDRMVQPGFIQLSGTSFATAAASGSVAALLELHPGWTPDQVKGALMASARQTGAVSGQLGVGEIDARAAAAVADPANPNAALNDFVAKDPTTGVAAFDSAAWRDTAMSNPTWSAVSWGVVSWGVVSWGVVSWGVNYWSEGAAAAVRGEEVVAATSLADRAHPDYLPAGGYWVSPPPR